MKPAPRLTKKPLPATRGEWGREVTGVRQFLLELDGIKDWMPGSWVRKQQSYYARRLKDLLNNPPPGGYTQVK